MARAEKKAILTDGPIGRQLFRLSLPMLVGILAMLGFNMVDTMFVGRLGTLPLAAMTVTFPIVMVFMSVSLGLSVSTSIAVSHALGRGNPKEARRLATDALGLGCILAVLMSGLGLLVLDAVLHALEGDLPTHADARAYMCVWLPGLLFVIAPMIGSMAIRATGDTVTPSAIIILGVAVNAVLDPILIFGLGPCPRLGIAGAAWATVISRAATLVAVVYLLRRRDRLLVSPFTQPRDILCSWRTILRTGIPIALNNLITPLQAGVLTRLSATLGAAVVAGLGVATRVESFGLTAIFSLQSVMGIFIAQNSGAGRWDRVRSAVVRTESFGLLYGTALFLVLLPIGRGAAALFDPEPAVVSAAWCYFGVVGVTFGLRAVYLVGSAGLNSLNRAADAAALTVLHGLVVAVPAAWVGSRFLGVPGLFAGVGVGNLVGGLATAYWLRRILRRSG